MKKLILLSLFIFTNFPVHSNPEPQEFERQVVNAYIYGFPLVLMDVTKNIMTSTATVTGSKAPINQFLFKRNDNDRYLQAWLDLSRQPIILTIPEMGNYRYFVSMIDAWTNVFFSLGTRITGNSEKNYVIVGPDWKEPLPTGLQQIISPTNTVLILGKILSEKSEDFTGLNRLQQEFKLKPVKATEALPITPENVNDRVSSIRQVFGMNGITFFTKLADLLKKNPIPSQDSEYVKKFSVFGFKPGEAFVSENLSADQIEKIDRSVKEAQANIKRDWNRHPLATTLGNWGVIKDIGNYGTNYSLRAAFAYGGLENSSSGDAIYPVTNLDSNGQLLKGENNYVIHFNKDRLPPVKGYWSITLYDSSELLLSLPTEEHAIGSRDKLKYNKDGSLDIYIQHESPGEALEANWLPSPKAEFTLILKFNDPEDSLVKGNWSPPPVTKVGSEQKDN